MAEVKIQLIAEDKGAVRKVEELGKAFDYLKESSGAFKHIEASIFDPKSLEYILKLAPAIGMAIKFLWEQLKDNPIEKTLKSIEPAVSKIKDLKTPLEELSGALKTISEDLKPIKEHFESISQLISKIKDEERFIAIWKDFQARTGDYVDFSELLGGISKLEKELSYMTGYYPTAFEGIKTSGALEAIKELHAKIEEPLALNLNPENFFHNLQIALDTFRNVRLQMEEPIALIINNSSALSAIRDVRSVLDSIPNSTYKSVIIKYMTQSSPIKPFSEGIEYIRQKMQSLPAEARHTVRYDSKSHSGNATSEITVNYNPQVTINTAEGNIREIERVLSERLSYERGELSRALRKVVS